jgi:cyclopropane fatty-acyl-phospholipid synthase-like methyltransferase
MFRRLFFFLSYLGKPRWDTGISPPELLEFLENHLPGRALDIGCGTGTNAITMAKHGWSVTGIDFMPNAIHQARKKTSRAGLEVTFLAGDVTQAAEPLGPFELVLDIGCFHSLNTQAKQAYQKNLSHLLASNGVFSMIPITIRWVRHQPSRSERFHQYHVIISRTLRS